MSKIKEMIVENEEYAVVVEALSKKLDRALSSLKKVDGYLKDGRVWLAEVQCEIIIEELGGARDGGTPTVVPHLRLNSDVTNTLEEGEE